MKYIYHIARNGCWFLASMTKHFNFRWFEYWMNLGCRFYEKEYDEVHNENTQNT